ncbi:UNVERIFIED_CONTAM: hypothetical protein O8I53_07455 [Campylobacter lari]
MRSGLPLEMVVSFIEPKEDATKEQLAESEKFYKDSAMEYEFKQFVAHKLDNEVATENQKAMHAVVSKEIDKAKKAIEEHKKTQSEKEESKESEEVAKTSEEKAE